MAPDTILIVEDEIIIAQNIKFSLERFDYKILAIVASGEKAIEKALELRPDLILMDIKLRGQMDGIEAATRIRAQLDVPVIYMTAFTNNEVFERAKKTEPYGYLIKPFEIRDLRTTIEMAIFKHRMQVKLKQSEARYKRLFEQSAAILTDTETLYHFSVALISYKNLAELIREVVDKVAKMLPARWVFLIMIDEEKQTMIDVIVNDRGHDISMVDTFEELMAGLSGWVIRNHKPALSPKDTSDPRESDRVRQRRRDNRIGSMVVVPLRYRDQILGTLTAANRLDEGDFTQRDVMLMTAMANQTAIAIENTRLLETAQQRVVELEAIRQAALSLTASLKPQEVLENLLQSALQLITGTSKAIIYLYQEEKLNFAAELAAANYKNKPMPPLRDNGVTYQVARTGQMTTIYDTTTHKKYIEVSDHYWAAAMISLPLKFRERVVGVMNIFHEAPHAWTESELRLLQLLGDHAAVAIENARLYEKARNGEEG